MKRGLERYRAFLASEGVPQEQIDAVCQEITFEKGELDAKRCPRCRKPIEGRRDPRQVGEGLEPGEAWFNYRCLCGYMCDRAELDPRTVN